MNPSELNAGMVKRLERVHDLLRDLRQKHEANKCAINNLSPITNRVAAERLGALHRISQATEQEIELLAHDIFRLTDGAQLARPR